MMIAIKRQLITYDLDASTLTALVKKGKVGFRLPSQHRTSGLQKWVGWSSSQHKQLAIARKKGL